MRVLIIDNDVARREAVARAMRQMRHECVAVGHDALQSDSSLLSSFGAVLVSMDLRRRIGIDVSQQLARHPGVTLAFVAAGGETSDQIAEAETLGPVLPTAWTAGDLARFMDAVAEPPLRSRRAAAGTPQWHRREVEVRLASWFGVLALCERRAFVNIPTDELPVGTVLRLRLHLPDGAMVETPARIAVVSKGNGAPVSFIEPTFAPKLRAQLEALARSGSER